MKTQLWVWVAVLLPVLGLSGLVVKAERAVRAGSTFRIPISGYDPRDLFHGRFMQYKFEFAWQGTSSCPAFARVMGDTKPAVPMLGSESLYLDCCLCLTRTSADGFNPKVRQVDCEEPQSNCDGWIRSRDMMPPRRHFVPEDRAQELERALMQNHASIELAVAPAGAPAVKELYLDNRPWRAAVQK